MGMVGLLALAGAGLGGGLHWPQGNGWWGLAGWDIFLDSPMAIEATEVYAHRNNFV